MIFKGPVKIEKTPGLAMYGVCDVLEHAQGYKDYLGTRPKLACGQLKSMKLNFMLVNFIRGIQCISSVNIAYVRCPRHRDSLA